MRHTFLFLAILIFLSCCREPELRRSVFIPDPEFPLLPQYSEWGYNTFGAYYNSEAMISNGGTPAQVTYHQMKTSFKLSGRLVNEGQPYGDLIAMTLVLSDFHPTSYQDLIALDKQVFDLTDPAFRVVINDLVNADTLEVLNGQFEIKRAQHLLVDEQSEEVILSGVFEFQAIVGGEPLTVSDGRFDVGIGGFNFFNY